VACIGSHQPNNASPGLSREACNASSSAPDVVLHCFVHHIFKLRRLLGVAGGADVHRGKVTGTRATAKSMSDCQRTLLLGITDCFPACWRADVVITSTAHRKYPCNTAIPGAHCRLDLAKQSSVCHQDSTSCHLVHCIKEPSVATGGPVSIDWLRKW
jgi:hypothetical protein